MTKWSRAIAEHSLRWVCSKIPYPIRQSFTAVRVNEVSMIYSRL